MKRVLEAITVNLDAAKSDNYVSNDGRRLFHGRGQCYQGLGHINVDWFAPVLLITLYQEVESPDWQQFLAGLASLTAEIDCAIVQRRYLRGGPIETLFGELPQQPLAVEQDLTFALSFGAKQNIGFFLDMLPGRQWIRERAEGKRVLNLFSYTCSFSVAAMASNAKSVVNIDMSRAALNVGRQNHCLNNQHERLKRDVEFLPYDVFRSWKKITNKGPYDIVIIDPPSRQKGSFVADKDYARVVRRIESLMPNGGELLACLNAPELGDDFLIDVFADECPQAEFVTRLANRDDFPESDMRRNLKMLHYRLCSRL